MSSYMQLYIFYRCVQYYTVICGQFKVWSPWPDLVARISFLSSLCFLAWKSPSWFPQMSSPCLETSWKDPGQWLSKYGILGFGHFRLQKVLQVPRSKQKRQLLQLRVSQVPPGIWWLWPINATLRLRNLCPVAWEWKAAQLESWTVNGGSTA